MGIDEQYLHIPRDFPGRSGQGGPGSGNSPEAQSDWERLVNGKTVGKSVNILWAGAPAATQRSSLPLLEIRGEDWQALQLSILLSPPRFSPVGTITQNTVANVQGSQNYSESLGNIRVFGNPGATIEWGIGGVSNEVDVDIGCGCQLNLGGASFVRVRAFIDPTGLGDPLIYTLGGFVNPGQCKGVGATRTINVGLVLNGTDSAVFAIPKFARGVQLNSAEQFIGEVLFFGSGTGTGVNGNVMFAFNTANLQYVPIPNGAYFFAIRSSAPVGNNFSAIFDLAL